MNRNLWQRLAAWAALAGLGAAAAAMAAGYWRAAVAALLPAAVYHLALGLRERRSRGTGGHGA